MAVSGIVLSPLAGTIARLLPGCLLRQWTGIPCPTCGATRAILAMSRLDPAAALRANPLAAASVAALMVCGLAAPWWLLAGGKIPTLPPTARRWLPAALLAAAVGNWFYLLLFRS